MVNTTSNADPIVEKMRKLKPGGRSGAVRCHLLRLYHPANWCWANPWNWRRVLVIIGDGNDNASKHTLNEVLELAQRNLVTIYGISTLAYGFDCAGDGNIIKLAQETGGRVEYPLQRICVQEHCIQSTSRPRRTKATTRSRSAPEATRRRCPVPFSSPSRECSSARSPRNIFCRYKPGRSGRYKLQFREINREGGASVGCDGLGRAAVTTRVLP